jgi:hypothetical protein
MALAGRGATAKAAARAMSSEIGGVEFSFWKTKSCYRPSVPFNDSERFGRTRRLFGPMERQKIWKKIFLVWILLQVLEIQQNRQRNLWKSLEKSG